MSSVPYTAARVERVAWAYRSPRGRRWAYAAVWAQPHSRVRVIVWTDGGRDRLLWFDTEADAQAAVDRMEQRLVAAGWTAVSEINTGQGFVLVSREDQRNGTPHADNEGGGTECEYCSSPS